jgi:hypothetical protein
MVGLLIPALTLVLLVCHWFDGQVAFRTKFLVTVLCFLAWYGTAVPGVIGWLFFVGLACLDSYLWWLTFGQYRGRR